MDSAGSYETMVKSQLTRRHISEEILPIKPLFALRFQFRVCVSFLNSGTILNTLFSNTAPAFIIVPRTSIAYLKLNILLYTI